MSSNPEHMPESRTHKFHKILITGANGMLATNTITKLTERGYQVKGMLRNKQRFKGEFHSNLELFEGHINNTEDIKKALEGCDSVIHAAAFTRQDVPKYKPYREINVDATRNILDAAIENELKKFIYVGTANSFGYGTKENPGTENIPPGKPFTNSFYAQSKTQGQDIVLSATDKINVGVVNPTFMLGAYGKGKGSDSIVKMGMKKHLVLFPPGGKNFIHAGDAANCIINILEKAPNGEAFLLSNQNLSYKEFFRKVIAQSHFKPLLIKVPDPLLKATGLIGSLLRMANISTNLSLTNMRILCIENYYSHQKARKYLPEKLKNTETAIKETLSWLNNQKS